MTTYQQQAERIYDRLIELERESGPDQLFLCSYLLGHVSLISSEETTAEDDSASLFNQRLQDSLDKAFGIDKLSQQDISDISMLWQQLQDES